MDASISQIATSVVKQLARLVYLQEFTLSFLKNLDAEYALDIVWKCRIIETRLQWR